MTLATYWTAIPVIGIALSAVGWLALLITRQPIHNAETQKHVAEVEVEGTD